MASAKSAQLCSPVADFTKLYLLSLLHLHPLLEAKENAAKAKVPLSSTLPSDMLCGRSLSQQYEDEGASSLEMALLETEDRLQEKRDEAQRPDDIFVSLL